MNEVSSGTASRNYASVVVNFLEESWEDTTRAQVWSEQKTAFKFSSRVYISWRRLVVPVNLRQ